MALSAGVGLKPPHFAAAEACTADGLWFEIHPENYMVEGGPRLACIDAIRARHPLSLHGVAASLAGAEAPDASHLALLRDLCTRWQPALVSEHLAWSRVDGVYLPDLLPVPRTRESLARVAANIDRVQSVLGRRIAIENPSHYLEFAEHQMSETTFLRELVRRSGCGLLIDVNNAYVSANNLGGDARAWIDDVPAEAVLEVHLAGHRPDPALGQALLIDTHDCAVSPAVWALYARLIRRIGPRPTLIEWDDDLPAFDDLMAERTRAEAILRVPARPSSRAGQALSA
jgi:uncharacterized protein